MGAGRHLTWRGDEDGLFGSAFEGGLEVESQPGFALMGIGVPSSCRKTTAGLFAVFDLEYLSLFLLFPDEAATGGVGEAPADSTLTLSLSRSPSASRTSWQRMDDDDDGLIAGGSGFGLENLTAFVVDGDFNLGREGDGDRVVVTTVLEARGYLELDDGTEARERARASSGSDVPIWRGVAIGRNALAL